MAEFPAEKNQNPKQDKGPVAALYGWLSALTFALFFLVLLFTFAGRVIDVDGHSMDPTLANGDLLLLQSVGYTPQQGDIVVLSKQFASFDNPLVKRIIAVGGQTVEVDYANNRVLVDGMVLSEPYILEAMRQPDSPYMTNDHLQVPEGSVFVMGDNRNHSSDSRDVRLGVVDNRYILGRVFFTLLPPTHFGGVS